MTNALDGATGNASLQVTASDTAQAFRSGTVPVFATPRLVALLEEAAVHALEGRLGEGETTVGTRIEVLHLSPTPVGGTVRAEARLVSTDGRLLRFAVVAFDDQAKVAEGAHERVIVNEQRFLERVLR